MDAATVNHAPTEAQRREAWLAARREHVTSSDIPAIMGLPDAYGSPMAVFLEKKKLLEKGEAPVYLEAGLRLQPVILEWYSDRRGVAIRHEDPYELVVSREHPIIAASLDGRWWDVEKNQPTVCVDAKNVRRVNTDEWGPEGTDEIPGRFVVQLHVQMLCTETPVHAELAALFAGAEPRWYAVPWDPEIAAGIIEAGETFWRDHVMKDIPPPVDASDDWTRWLNSRPVRGDYVEATAEILKLRKRAVALARAGKVIEERETLAKNQIRDFIGERPGMWFTDPATGKVKKVHYKRNKDGQDVDTDGALQALAAEFRFDLTSFMRQFTKTKPGARPLMLGKDD